LGCAGLGSVELAETQPCSEARSFRNEITNTLRIQMIINKSKINKEQKRIHHYKKNSQMKNEFTEVFLIYH
jgi:hypothetical protein